MKVIKMSSMDPTPPDTCLDVIATNVINSVLFHVEVLWGLAKPHIGVIQKYHNTYVHLYSMQVLLSLLVPHCREVYQCMG